MLLGLLRTVHMVTKMREGGGIVGDGDDDDRYDEGGDEVGDRV